MSIRENWGDAVYQWPYPIKYEETTVVETDVLVIGGGHAGCCAAIAAARRGARVAVADKAPIRRSGCGGAGTDHYNNLISSPGSPITPEEYMDLAADIHFQGHRNYIAIKGTWNALMELEKLGLNIRDEDGDFIGDATEDESTKLLKGYDYADMIAVKLKGGHYLKPILYEGLKRAGCDLYERVMITNLLTADGQPGHPITGAIGFSMKTGECFVFHAPCVILATGYICTMWTYNLDITGNSYRWDPNEIGDGFAMAWRAGAKSTGMFKNGQTHGSHPFAWPRFGTGNSGNTWYPCTIVDNRGKEIPWADLHGNPISGVQARNLPVSGQPYMGSGFDPLHGIETPTIIKDLPDRIKSGEFELPLWADLAGMPEEERRSIWGVMVGNEGKSRYTLYDLYTRSGFDPDRDMLMCPIMMPEHYGRGGGGWFQGEAEIAKSWRSEAFGYQGELCVDWDLMTDVPGLYVAGAASGLEGCSLACSSGFYAGNRASEFARSNPVQQLNHDQVIRERDHIYAPIKRAENPSCYISWKELWGGTARAMQQTCADYKTKPVLEQGLIWLDSIASTEASMTYARNPHELARVLEDDTRLTVSRVFMQACMAKIDADSQGIDIEHDRYMINSMKDGRFITEYRDPRYWLEEPESASYLENYERHRAQEEKEAGR